MGAARAYQDLQRTREPPSENPRWVVLAVSAMETTTVVRVATLEQ